LLNAAFPGAVPPSATTVRAIVEERLLAGNALLSWCAIEGWDKQLARLPEPADVAARPDDRGPRRSAYFTPVRFSDAITILGPGEGYHTTEHVVRLWRRLDGGTANDVAGELATCEPLVGGLAVGEIDAAVGALLSIGAVGFVGARPDGTAVGSGDGGSRFVGATVRAAELMISPTARFHTSSALRG
jgi:hypothetical protein